MSDQWLEWAKRIQSLSQAGLTFSKNEFDLERYEELRKISAEIMEKYTGLEMKKVRELFTNESGYQTPKVDVRGAVFKENRILMVKEKSDDKWSLPGGFCDVGLSPSENIVKEMREESGYQVRAVKLLALLDMNKHLHLPQAYHYYKVFVKCEIEGGHASVGLETSHVSFFSEDKLPNLSIKRNTESQIKMLFSFLRDPGQETIFD